MSRGDEVRLMLGGDEIEIRRISAFELLDARRKARELASEIGAEGEDEKLVLAAAITAQSAFLDNAPAFESVMDALERLTAEEIFKAAAENSAAGAGEAAEETQYAAPARTEEPSVSAQRRSADAGSAEAYAAVPHAESPAPPPEAQSEKRQPAEDA